MKKIISIEFCNYKAFYDKGEQNKIIIPDGKNLLLYGENGSGKTSVFEGLKQFFKNNESPARHIAVPQNIIVNPGTPDEETVSNEVTVKINFQDLNNGSIEEKIYGVPTETVTGTNYINKINLLNSFLSYRELLKTYLMDNVRDKEEFRKKFAILLIENILSQKINSATDKPYIESWNYFKIKKLRYKSEVMKTFAEGMRNDINKINLIINEILVFFEPNLKVELVLYGPEIEYIFSAEKNRLGYYPTCGVDLKVKMFGNDIENEEENHLTVLNEARLSSLAISIYLSALINTPQDDFEYKLLFLDDIFIGLDMSNRLPLLNILTKFKKPIVDISLNDDGKLIEIIQVVDGITQYEPKLFFIDYQVIVTTYDRNWFEIARQFFVNQVENKWSFIEMFVDDTSYRFSVPAIIPLDSKINKAIHYLHKHDYRACAAYLRSMCEEELDRILPNNKYKKVESTNEQGNKVTKDGNLNDKILGFELMCKDGEIDFTPFKNIKLYKNHLLNSLSHNDISSPIFKKELLETIDSINQLKRITVKKIPDGFQDFEFKSQNNLDIEISVRIRKRESIFFICFDGVYSLLGFNKCHIESVLNDGVNENFDNEFNSLRELYVFVCGKYNINPIEKIEDVICKRERHGNVILKSLSQIIQEI